MNTNFDNNLTDRMWQLVTRVESFTGKTIVFEVDDNLAVPAKVSMARGNKPSHVIERWPGFSGQVIAILK